MADQGDWLKQPFAHRGLHTPEKGIIENTQSAFQAAIDAGFGIELDVRPAGDGEIVVFHDATLDRLTKSSGRVDTLDAAALKKVAFKNGTDRIQTLAELLEQVAGRVPLLIELKTDWVTHGPAERRIGALLSTYKGDAAVMSFDPKSIALFSREMPHITRGFVAEAFTDAEGNENLSFWQRFMMRHLLSAFSCRPHFVNYDVTALPACGPWVWRKILRRPLLAWTVRSHEQHLHALQWADAIVFEQYQPGVTQ